MTIYDNYSRLYQKQKCSKNKRYYFELHAFGEKWLWLVSSRILHLMMKFVRVI